LSEFAPTVETSFDELNSREVAALAVTQPAVLLQAIHCGSHGVAVTYQWAHAIVDRFDVVPVPKAPLWLMGATVIDAQVLPVIDLSLFIDPTHQRPGAQRDLRLLVGGREDGGLDDPPLAFLFDGLPQQLRWNASEVANATGGTPTRIAPFTDGVARSTQGEAFHVINIQRLASELSAELSVL
jgi:chemotaxis signal transduction protein